ncbi:MAG TPA: MATE family efflux transporter [Terriglobales bacterium]|nr:MATE family efflux transporter [Terriglobales bacterium]
MSTASEPINARISALSVFNDHRDYILTFGAEISIFLSQMILYRWIANGFGKQAFDEFALARRSITLLQPVLLLGLSVALPRHLSFAVADKDHPRATRLYGATLLMVAVTCSLALAATALFNRPLALAIFGASSYSTLLVSLTTMVVGIVAHSVVYAFFRGTLNMTYANLLQFINLGVIPVIVYCFVRSSISAVLVWTGVCWIVVAVAFGIRTPLCAVGFHRFEIKQLFVYGIQRVGGDFLVMALMTLPAVVLAHVAGIEHAGAMAFGMSFLTMFGAVFGPASIVLLPKASRMLACGRHNELRSHVRSAFVITITVALLLTIAVESFSDQIVTSYLGTGYEDVAAYLKILALASVPYALYCVLRGVIDAYYVSGVNSWNLFLSFLVFCLVTCFAIQSQSSELIAIAVVSSLYVLCVLTLYRILAIVRN